VSFEALYVQRMQQSQPGASGGEPKIEVAR
jgi:hypothetical protein